MENISSNTVKMSYCFPVLPCQSHKIIARVTLHHRPYLVIVKSTMVPQLKVNKQRLNEFRYQHGTLFKSPKTSNRTGHRWDER